MNDTEAPKQPTFTTPAEMRAWWGEQLIEMSRRMRKTAVSTRINSLSKGLTVWLQAYKAEKELATVEELEKAVDELRRQILGGPIGTVDASEN